VRGYAGGAGFCGAEGRGARTALPHELVGRRHKLLGAEPPP
jgi:hypothetical protein